MPRARGTAIKAIRSGFSERKLNPLERAVKALARASKKKPPLKDIKDYGYNLINKVNT